MDNERESKSKSFEKDKYFDSQIQKWESLSYGSYIKVGVLENTHPLCLVGMPSGILRYDVSKINKNMSKHASYLTVGLLKEIPNIIDHPIAITEFTEDSTVNVFGNVFVNGHPMMIGVTISKDRVGNDISKIRTYNLRRDVEKIITDMNILYLDDNKKRTQEWFQACGKQVPLGGNKFGFIRSISQKSPNVNDNERKSKIPEKNGVTWDDITKGDDSFKDAEDNSDIIVHPPATKKKTTEKETPKAEAKKEMKKAKKPLKITKALTEDEARNIVAYIMEDHFKEITEDTKMAYLPKNVRKDIFDKLTHIAGTNDMKAYVGKVYEVAELLCNEAVIREQYDISDRADVDEIYLNKERLE